MVLHLSTDQAWCCLTYCHLMLIYCHSCNLAFTSLVNIQGINNNRSIIESFNTPIKHSKGTIANGFVNCYIYKYCWICKKMEGNKCINVIFFCFLSFHLSLNSMNLLIKDCKYSITFISYGLKGNISFENMVKLRESLQNNYICFFVFLHCGKGIFK